MVPGKSGECHDQARHCILVEQVHLATFYTRDSGGENMSFQLEAGKLAGLFKSTVLKRDIST